LAHPQSALGGHLIGRGDDHRRIATVQHPLQGWQQ